MSLSWFGVLFASDERGHYRPFLEAALAVHDPGFPAVIEGGVLSDAGSANPIGFASIKGVTSRNGENRTLRAIGMAVVADNGPLVPFLSKFHSC